MFLLLVLSVSVLCALAREVNVNCANDAMVVVVEYVDDVVKFILSDSLTDPSSCEFTEFSTEIAVPLEKCGTVVSFDETTMVFTNTLTGVLTEDVTMINRGALLVISVKCTYQRTGKTNELMWENGINVVDESAAVSFSFGMDVFSAFADGSVSEQITEFPSDLEFLEIIYSRISFQIELETGEAMDMLIKVVMVDLMFSDNENAQDEAATKYAVFTDGCITNAGTYEQLDDIYLEKSFSINTTDVLSGATESLFLHALVRLCGEEEEDFATCMDACQNDDSAKRDVENIYSEFSIYLGEFKPAPVLKGERICVSIRLFLLAITCSVIGFTEIF